MNRKNIFIQGIILIAITMVANVILANRIFSERIGEITAGHNSLVRSVDHIFTALTYMERNSNKEFDEKIKAELDEARKSLRSPELLRIRRKP
jgi:hypothetical protein